MVVLCLKMLLAFAAVTLPVLNNNNNKQNKNLNPILNVLIREEKGKNQRVKKAEAG